MSSAVAASTSNPNAAARRSLRPGQRARSTWPTAATSRLWKIKGWYDGEGRSAGGRAFPQKAVRSRHVSQGEASVFPDRMMAIQRVILYACAERRAGLACSRASGHPFDPARRRRHRCPLVPAEIHPIYHNRAYLSIKKLSYSNERAIRRRSDGFRVSLPVPCQTPSVVPKPMIALGFSAQGEPEKIFSLSFPARQGKIEASFDLGLAREVGGKAPAHRPRKCL
jgi:hypothetical protein